MNKVLTCAVVVAALATASAVAQSGGPRPPVTGSGAVAAQAKAPTKVDTLVAAMTLEEKLGRLYGATDPAGYGEAGYIPGVPRLNVPPLRLSDGPAGIRTALPATTLPAPVSMASTFSVAIREGARPGCPRAASERRARTDGEHRARAPAPELWHADMGTVEPASYKTADGRTIVSLTLRPIDAVFVVFRKVATAPSRTVARSVETKLASVEGSWDVAFQPNRGAPPKITPPALASWHEHADPGVKYFSGTGTYTKTIQAPAEWFQAGAKLWLDLGNVKNIAEVTVNGKALGTYWKAPFRVDVTSALKPGANTVEIKVINLWVNRLIGDQQEGVTTKYTYTAQQFYAPTSRGCVCPRTGTRRRQCAPEASLTGAGVGGRKNRASVIAASDAAASGTMNSPRKSVTAPWV